MADDTYTTLLNFVTESGEANRDINATTENLKKMEEQTKKVSKAGEQLGNLSFPGDELSKDFDLFTKAFDKSYKVVEGDMRNMQTGAKVTGMELRKFANSSAADLQKALSGIDISSVDTNKIRENARKIGHEISKELSEGLRTGELTEGDLAELEGISKGIEELKEMEEARKSELRTAVSAHRIKAVLYNREAQILNKTASDIRQNAEILRNSSQQLQGISQLALGAGVGIVGGIFGFASKYVRDAKEATTVTTAWKAAQESLGESGQRIGSVLAQEALPMLRLAAQTAEKASQFIEKHPEIVRAALNAGVVLAGLGAVGLAVSKGIKLYADQLYLSSIPLQLRAGELQFAAAQEQLAAARIRAGTPAVPGGGAPQTGIPGGGVGGFLATGLVPFIGLLTASVAGSKQLGDQLDSLQERMTGVVKNAPLVATLFKGIENGLLPLFPFIAPLRQLKQHLPDVTSLLEKLGFATEKAAKSEPLTGVRGSSAFEQVLRAYEDYRKDDLALVQKHYAERQAVISSSLAAESAANRRFTSDSNRLSAQTGNAIRQATEQYEQQARNDEVKFAQERAQIIRDSGEEIKEIEENLQERLRQLRTDHEDRLEELVSSRDALGIVKEQQRYNRERAEEVRQANLEIRQKRADLAVRLQEQQQQFLQERAQRFAEFQSRIEEIRRQGAEQQKELAARHREEVLQIRQQRAERLKELDNQFKDERKRRYEYFVDNIRNLDAALLGEEQLRKRRQDEMIAELDRFLSRYNSGLTGLLQNFPSPAATRARGGYATYGTYVLGDKIGGGRGKPEYVLGGELTELAERVLGGRLSQDKLAAFLGAANGGSRNNVTYNDGRRFDSRISSTDRESIVDDTLSALSVALRRG